MAEDRKLAIFDLGSNSLRLMVVAIDAQKHPTVIHSSKAMVRLGEGAFASHSLQEAAMERTLEAMGWMSQICERLGATDIRAITTAAVRESENGRTFLERIREQTGVAFEIAEGRQEARLVALGVVGSMAESDALRVCIDIGGGSTEIAVVDGLEVVAAESLPAGCVRAAERFFAGGKGRASKQAIRAAVRTIARENRSALQALSAALRDAGAAERGVEFIASSGTALSLAALSSTLSGGRSEASEDDSSGLSFTRKSVKRICRQLGHLTAAERASVPGMNPRRTSVLIPGAAVMLALLEHFGCKYVRASSRGLSDGVLMETLGLGRSADLRQHSIEAFGRHFKINEDHACHVRAVALALWDQMAGHKRIASDSQGRAWLSYAAYLHAVGIAVNYKGYGFHSGWLIRHSALPGFSRHDLALMALIATRMKPKAMKQMSQWRMLAKPDRRAALEASACVRVAAALEMRHAAAVESLACNPLEGVLSVCCRKGATVDEARVAKALKSFGRVFGCPEIKLVLTGSQAAKANGTA